jgi:cellobiose-specific phosphotransferase system component IIB
MNIDKEQAYQSDNSEDIDSISGEEAQRIARSKDEELIATQIFWALRDVREHLAKSGYEKEMGKHCFPQIRADLLIRDYLQNVLVNADLSGFCTSLVKLLMPDAVQNPNFLKPHLAILGNESFMEDTKEERLGQYTMSTFEIHMLAYGRLDWRKFVYQVHERHGAYRTEEVAPSVIAAPSRTPSSLNLQPVAEALDLDPQESDGESEKSQDGSRSTAGTFSSASTKPESPSLV